MRRHRIYARNYTISTLRAFNFDYPKFIKVEGSYNSGPWTVLQNQNIGEDMHEYNKKLFYPLKPGLYDSFKFTMIGKNFNDNYVFLIYQLDFFGILFWNDKIQNNSCTDRSFYSMLYFLSHLVFILI